MGKWAARVLDDACEEVAARMGHAPDLDDPARDVEGVVARAGVGLQVPAELAEERAGPGGGGSRAFE